MLEPKKLLHWIKSGGRPGQARLSRWRATADQIMGMSAEFESLSDDDLLKRSRKIRWQAKAGVDLATLVPESFALVREAAWRALSMRHFPVQLMGGMALFEGGIAEMQTGEGKTLTAVLPTYIRALAGEGCHVITVNDYLAARDAETMGRVHHKLGLTVGCITETMKDDQRRAAYARDITYGTAKEMGFDFLRDRLKRGADITGRKQPALFGGDAQGDSGAVQRNHHFALIDEADSILVDEARTPLIIALNQPNDPATVGLYRWCSRIAQELAFNVDFVYEPERRSAYLTDAGCRRIMLMAKPTLIDTVDMPRMYKQVERALVAHWAFQRDRDYVIHESEIMIVDESTGRMMEGRKWQEGLHQAIEAKEAVPITASSGQAARITVQNFFRHYTHIAGMTGTAAQVSRELYKTFQVRVTVIPTHRPCIRKGLPYRIFHKLQHKMEAIVQEIELMRAKGRAILIGTPSVDRSELLGKMLAERRIPHQILNARYHEQEAEIVKGAGEPGKVTIATNMAGRGTDIMLTDEVRAAGGLHVIATELHSSARIDRQLVGRAARQGDPGTFQFFLSLEDELLRCLKTRRLESLRKSASPNAQGELSLEWLRFFRKTQRTLEKQHVKQRRELLRAERNRTEMYERMGLDPYLEMTE